MVSNELVATLMVGAIGSFFGTTGLMVMEDKAKIASVDAALSSISKSQENIESMIAADRADEAAWRLEVTKIMTSHDHRHSASFSATD